MTGCAESLSILWSRTRMIIISECDAGKGRESAGKSLPSILDNGDDVDYIFIRARTCTHALSRDASIRRVWPPFIDSFTGHSLEIRPERYFLHFYYGDWVWRFLFIKRGKRSRIGKCVSACLWTRFCTNFQKEWWKLKIFIPTKYSNWGNTLFTPFLQ